MVAVTELARFVPDQIWLEPFRQSKSAVSHHDSNLSSFLHASKCNFYPAPLPFFLTEDNKKTYSHLEFYFHYICENRIVYMLITHGDFERSKAFAFLTEIKKRFLIQYGERVYTALPYAMNRYE